MLEPHLMRRASHLLDGEMARTLTDLITRDAAQLGAHPHQAPLFPALQAALAGDTAVFDILQAAWMGLYVAICRLDHLQDGDPESEPLPALGTMGAQYNVVFAAYVLAESLLDDLAPLVPAARLLRLRRFWGDMLLRMAGGQQRDLQGDAAGLDDLDTYQQIAQAKTGATFALACGGAAILCTDDDAIIAALTYAGEVYGTLIQYGDDLHDAASQPNLTITLPRALRDHPMFARDDDQEHILATFWSYLLTSYCQAVQQALANQPARIQQHIGELFTQVFGLPTAQDAS